MITGERHVFHRTQTKEAPGRRGRNLVTMICSHDAELGGAGERSRVEGDLAFPSFPKTLLPHVLPGQPGNQTCQETSPVAKYPLGVKNGFRGLPPPNCHPSKANK